MEKLNSKVFLKVVETKSFVKAAQELSYTQAGISYIVKAMEEELGFELFIRDRSGVRLTPEGEELLPVIRDLENDVRLLENRINDVKGLERGTIKIITFDSASVHLLPLILKEYTRDFPGIDPILVTVEDSKKAEEMIARREADCAFFLHSPVSKELYSRPLFEEKLKAIVSRDHPLTEKGFFPVAELGNYKYIALPFEDVTGIRDIFTARGVKPDISYNIDNDYTAMAMVSAGHGFCIFPELLLQNMPFDVKALDFDEPVKRVVSIGTKSLETASMAALKFIDYTVKWVSENH